MKTSHRLVMLTTALAWVSCTDGLFKRCPTGTECGTGEVCLDAVCVVQVDGDAGSAGGLAGGAAGGASGGMSGGTSGGSAGGVGPDDAGPSVQVRLVSSPPAIDIIPASVLEPRFRRDDEVLVEVWSNDTDVDPAQTRVLMGVGDVRFTPEGPCDAGAVCARVRVRLANVELPAIEATLELRARMVDRAGNGTSVPLDGGVPTTRLAWARPLCQGCRLTGPALSPAGTLLVVAATGADAGELFELAADGGTVSRKPTIDAQFLSSIATGTAPQMWSAVLTRQGVRFSRNMAYGFYPSQGTESFCEGSSNLSSTNRDMADAPALVDPGSPQASVIGIRNYTGLGSQLGRYGPTRCPGSPSGEVEGIRNVGFPSNIVISRATGMATGYILDVERGLTSFTRNDRTNPGMVTNSMPSATFDAGVVGLAFIAEGTTPELAFTTQNELVLTRFPSSVNRVAGTSFSRPIAIDGGVVVVEGMGAQLRTFSRLSDGGVTDFGQRLSGFSSSPRPAAPIAGSSELYAIDDNTVVYAIRRSDGGVSTFERPRDVQLGMREGEPTLWCRRGRSNALFTFTTSTGYLVALIVDSARVDGNAPWPLPFHDTQNTNAADTVERACP